MTMIELLEEHLSRLFTMTGDLILTRKTKPYLEGQMGIYDSTLFNKVVNPSQIKDKRVLDIGPLEMVSSADFLRAGAREVVVVEPFPFGIDQKIDAGLDELVALHGDIAGYDSKRMKVVQEYLGRGFDLSSLGAFESAYFFFPAVPLIGNYPEYAEFPSIEKEFNDLVKETCNRLTRGGIFSLITEVPISRLRKVEIPGFTHDAKRFRGKKMYSESERVLGWRFHSSSTPLIRPASKLGVTLLQYKRQD